MGAGAGTGFGPGCDGIEGGWPGIPGLDGGGYDGGYDGGDASCAMIPHGCMATTASNVTSVRLIFNSSSSELPGRDPTLLADRNRGPVWFSPPGFLSASLLFFRMRKHFMIPHSCTFFHRTTTESGITKHPGRRASLPACREGCEDRVHHPQRKLWGNLPGNGDDHCRRPGVGKLIIGPGGHRRTSALFA